MRLPASVRLFVCVLGASLCAVGTANAAKRVVDPDGQGSSTNCNGSAAAYTSIAVAMAAAVAGDSIYICPGPGPYNEQLTVAKNLKFIGIGGATIKPSPLAINTTSLATGADIAAAIVVEAGFTVTIDQLTIDGADNGITGCSPNPIGVYFRNGAGAVTNSVVKNFRLGAGLEGCQAGLGILAQATSGAPVVNLSGNNVHDFQKGGIVGDRANVTVNTTGNRVTGDGPTSFIAQNGIQISRGAKGTVSGNLVSEVVYSQCVDPSAPDPNPCNNGSSTGILIFEATAAITVERNTVTTTQTGIYLDGPGSLVSQNVITNTLQYDGIYLPAGADGNTITGNGIGISDESGIWVDGTSNNIFKSRINEAPIGIHAACGNVIGTGSNKNTFYNVPVPTDVETCLTSVAVAAVGSARSPKPSPAD
jgi:hypothetical protein